MTHEIYVPGRLQLPELFDTGPEDGTNEDVGTEVLEDMAWNSARTSSQTSWGGGSLLVTLPWLDAEDAPDLGAAEVFNGWGLSPSRVLVS